jgi:ABC-2 type transport system permease protein
MNAIFAWHRFLAVVRKEFIQMRRDRLTFGMMVGVPLLQLILFGFAINTDPKRLPIALLAAENSEFVRTFLQALENTEYFEIVGQVETEAEAHALLERGEVQFILNFPPDFTRALVRGERPPLLLEADATDPAASSNAVAAITTLIDQVWDRDLEGTLADRRARPGPAELRIHRRYNPAGITQYNIVPALLGVVLNMTMVLITALAITRERERGTMETLLATPLRPLEVMLGKIVPYILVGYIQVSLILLTAATLFDIPMRGSIVLLYLLCMSFILACLAVGITFSTLAQNQLQAMQMSFFFFLPSILLSGFMFPFRGMPLWAQGIGEALPLTHFLRLTRGILLKGNGLAESWPHVWPILVFLIIVVAIGAARYRQTLD